MSMTADQIVDRRRLRRKVTFWRVTGFIAVVLVILLAIALGTGREGFPLNNEPQIARITISGFIADDPAETRMLADLAGNDAVKGVIVAINSTGGATTGGEALYEGLRKLAAAKPTVATIGTFGASAAYMAAIATDHIVARRTSITGSIGVLFVYPNVSELLTRLGITVEDIKSAPLKASPSPWEKTSPEARAIMEGVVKDTFDWFVDIVAERRNMPRGVAAALADGRVYTGHQALGAQLIDEIGAEPEAIAWLGTKGVDTKLPIRDWAPQKSGGGFFPLSDAVLVWFAQKMGLDPLVAPLLNRVLPEGLKLDGLLSVWQGQSGAE